MTSIREIVQTPIQESIRQKNTEGPVLPIRKGWPRWEAAREAAGINPHGETTNMRLSDVKVYRQLSKEKPVSEGTLGKALRPGVDPKKARASVVQALVRLRRILPASINKSVVNVGAQWHAEYLLAEVGKEKEAIERYAKERERRAVEDAERQRQEKEALRPKKILLSRLPLGVDVVSNELFHMMYPNTKEESARQQTSRLIKQAKKDIEVMGETILCLWKGGKNVYTRVRIDDIDRVRAEIGTQRFTRRLSNEPTPFHENEQVVTQGIMEEIIDESEETVLEESVELIIYPARDVKEDDEEAPLPEVTFEGIGQTNIHHDELFGMGVILRAPMAEGVRNQFAINILKANVDTVNEVLNKIMSDEERRNAQSRFASEIFLQSEQRVIDYLLNKPSYQRLNSYERWMLRWFDGLSPEQASSFFSALRPILKIS